MKIFFKDFEMEASNLHEISKAICDQLTIPDDIPEGTPDEIEYILDSAERILEDNFTFISKNGEQLMETAKADLGDLLFYCANHGYETPDVRFFNESEGNETGNSFCQILLLYIEVHYWDMMKEGIEKKGFSVDLVPAAEGGDFTALEEKIFTSSNNAVYICSPLRGQTPEETYQNMLAARKYMLAAYRLTGDPAVAPHAYLPVVLDDMVPEEREYGLLAGKKLLYRCKKLYVCGDRISEGMKGEILEAAVLGRPIVTFSKDMFCKVGDLICSDDCPGCGGGVYLMSGYDELAKPSDMIK